MIFEGTKKSIFFWSGVDTSRADLSKRVRFRTDYKYAIWEDYVIIYKIGKEYVEIYRVINRFRDIMRVFD